MGPSLTGIEVGMADMKVAVAPNILITRGLGSCLGVVLYDPIQRIGGLAHPMLPKMKEGRVQSNRCKFVDSAVALMIERLKEKGCGISALHAKVFGGGHMFSSIPANSVFNIGARNLEAAQDVLKQHNIRILVRETGGNYGRTLFFDLSTGLVKVKTLFRGEKEL